MKSSEDYTSYTDETLIRLIAQSQEQALAQLYDRYHRRIYNLVLAIVYDPMTAEEITLDVFMRVWQKAGTYRAEQAKASTWLISIARHHAIDVLRRRVGRSNRLTMLWEESISHVESSGSNTQELAEVALRREHIHAALANLSPEQKQALVLAYFGGYTQDQIAELLAQPLGTIKTRIRLALLKLREFLSEERADQAKSIAPESAYSMNKKE
jgi:RNA polymerase sigma-70 factor (ECF subfamily)